MQYFFPVSIFQKFYAALYCLWWVYITSKQSLFLELFQKYQEYSLIRSKINWKLFSLLLHCVCLFVNVIKIIKKSQIHFFYFFLPLEPTYITIGPPTCEILVNCTLTEKDCIYSFKLDQNGCRICQCKTSEYAEIQWLLPFISSSIWKC